MFTITRLLDGIFEIPAAMFLYVGDEAKGAHIRAEKAGAGTVVPVNCFLLRRDAEVILIDAGTGPAWGPALGDARAALAAEGMAPESVDRVILTHIHGDHALGLFADEAAYFPRARISVPAADLAFFTDEAARAAMPEGRRAAFDIAARLLAVYAGRIDVSDGEEAHPGITALPLPGHTPGHTGYRFATAEGDILLWGDALHIADVQPRDPRVGLFYDTDRDLAWQSRRKVLAYAAAAGLRVGGGHIDGFLRVVADGEGFRLES